MIIKCLCGTSLTNIGYPNSIEHLLVSTQSQECLQDLVDREVSENGEVDMWSEHWDTSNAIIVWKCYECGRLYFNAEGDPEQITVYKIEQQGTQR